MKILVLIIILLITLNFIYKYNENRSKRISYLKAGKKWDGIVKELSKRK